ncbi:hypothetical protein IW261DRAFT_1519432 [Armillaria novae-zelandiae]|uniref:Uncharacterized protein n=1 Tax=Armillaria novae-zelandiae TaxID=153914 RepID=A0AA39NKZ7_9AGAR|nr:hypothetical protein IW261DRAFT_1519432 [Armillaria novae-zelandiae]
MANDAPPQSLALSDIMHTLSPSPSPQNTEYTNGTDAEERARSPGPSQEADLKSYRSKLSEMGFLSGETDSATPRERELANMVLRLLDARQWDPAQLAEQASTISELMQERDLTLELFSEERARWTAEKEGWERSAEALISQRTKETPDVFKTEQMTYFNSLLESDNKAKTEKLQEALARLSSLEAELAKLKPILLLQPFPPTARPSHSALLNASTYLSSLPYPAATGDSALAVQKQRGAKKKKDKVPPPAHGGSDEDNVVAEGSASTSMLDPSLSTNGQTSYLSAAQASPQSQYRFAVDVYAHLRPKQPQGQTVYSKKGRPARAKETKASQPTTLSSDARTEHILLAARKIGRERATVVSSVTQAERIAREQERLEKERARPTASSSHYRGVTSPRTPKRAPAASGSNHYLHVGGSGYLYSPSPGAGLYQNMLTPQARQVGRPSPAGSSKNPPTPLDSLVDVALNMAEDSPPSRRRRRAASPESPSQKRRRSALDVLADQAAAYGKEEGKPRATRARLGKAAAPRIISPAPRVIERGEEGEKGGSLPPDADVDADGDIDPDIEMEPRHSDLDGNG